MVPSLYYHSGSRVCHMRLCVYRKPAVMTGISKA